jgi:RHS repeat-associated protein
VHLIIDVNGYFIEEAGSTVAYHVYYPFGEEATAFDQDTIREKLTGHERDLGNLGGAGDDLDYMVARHCSPLTGRFLSSDRLPGKLDLPQSWNRYSYVWNNPLALVDPNGEEPLDYSLRTFLQGFYDTNFAGVQVHGGWFARSVTRMLHAEAFTAGNHIFFSKEGWSSYKALHDTAQQEQALAGILLTAHELTHTAQSHRFGLTVLAVRYLYYLATVGYWQNPFEAAARAKALHIAGVLAADPEFLASIQAGPAAEPSPALMTQSPGLCCWQIVTSISNGPFGDFLALSEFGGELWIDGINLTGVLTTSRPRL